MIYNQIAVFGDSIEAWSRPTCMSFSQCGWIENAGVALAVANPSQNLRPNNHALSGETQTVSFAKAQAQIPAPMADTIIKFAYWKMWSANDGNSAAIILSDYNTYIPAFVSLCQANDVIPVLATHPPSAQVTTVSADNQRIACNANLAALVAGSGNTMVLVDLDTAMSAGGSPATLIASYTNDGIHFNATGSSVAASVLEAAIQAYINSH